MIEGLKARGADVKYFDPYVPAFGHEGISMRSEPALTPELVAGMDLVVVTAAHTCVDYAMVQKNAKRIFDTKNALRHILDRDNIEVL